MEDKFQFSEIKNDKKRITLKNLSEKLDTIQEQLIEVKHLKDKIIDLEKTIQSNVLAIQNLMENKKCDKLFDSKRTLKKHIAEEHSSRIYYKMCDKTFKRSCDLEMHIKSVHVDLDIFECDQCDKKFVMMWRAQKHQSIHSKINRKAYHYFNIKNSFPFKELGCMFALVTSASCGQSCANKPCPYRHK